MKTLVEQLRQYATKHYTEDGWDILVECWTDEYIYEITKHTKSYEQAINACKDVLVVMNGFRKDIEAEAF